MSALTLETEIDAETLARLDELDVPRAEGIRRAVALYDVLENADQMLADTGELEGER